MLYLQTSVETNTAFRAKVKLIQKKKKKQHNNNNSDIRIYICCNKIYLLA